MTTPVDSPHSGCKTFTLTIDMNNAVFEENGIGEIQGILDDLVHRFNRSPEDTGGFVKDSAGRTVGDWEITAPSATFKEQVDELEQAITSALCRSMTKRSQIAIELHGRLKTLRVGAPESEWPRLAALKTRILNELLGMKV